MTDETLPLPTPAGAASRAGRAAVGVVAALVAIWVIAICAARFHNAFEPWHAETDAKQITHRFYAWSDPGTFPDGELLEEYARIYSAPVFFNIGMAALSSVIDAKDAAIVINISVYLGILLLLAWVGWRRGSLLVGLAAVVLFTHAEMPWKIIAGGHPRTFAPLLTALFLASLVSGNRRLMLVTLVLQGGIYPSPLLACGPAAAVVVAFDFIRERRFKPVLAFAIASVVALGLAKMQDLQSPAEWGEVISYEEAVKHPAWRAGSRFPYTPLPPAMRHPEQAFDSIVAPTGGAPTLPGDVTSREVRWVWAVSALLAVVFFVRRRRFADATETPASLVPWPELLLLTACLFAHVLARHMAFKLHIPHRAVSHGWPLLIASLAPWTVYLAARALSLRRAAGPVAFALTAGIVLLFGGFGFHKPPSPWRNYGRDAKLYTWLQKETPKDALFAGNFQIMDETPVFGHRRVYVNWKLAHPYRLGYFKLIQERTFKMYSAYYAQSVDDVLRFAEETGVDYMIVDESRFKKLERGDGQLFEPLRSQVAPLFERCRKRQCALNPPPPEAVVFSNKTYKVVDLARLKAFAGTWPPADTKVQPAAPDAVPARDDADTDAPSPDED